MAENSKFFDSGGGNIRSIGQTDYADVFNLILGSGVVKNVTNELNCTNSGYAVTVPPGKAVINGFFYENTADKTLTLASAGASDRYDCIVLELDTNVATAGIIAKTVQGTVGGGVPSITTNQMKLATYRITSAGVITKYADDRTYVANYTIINSKQNTITGAASSIVSSNLTANMVVIVDASGKIAASGITSAKLGYLTDVTSNIQAQINGKLGSTAKAADSGKIDGHKIFVQTSQPTATATGDVWIDY